MIQTPLNRSRSDKFILVLDLPLVLKRKFDNVLEDNFKIDPIQLSIFGSPVPSINVPSIDVSYGGQVYKTSSFSRPAYDSLALKFLIDNGYKNYWILWNWLNTLNDYKTSISDAHTVESPLGGVLKNKMSEYTSTFTVYGLDEYNNKIISFQYNHAFPTQLSEISFSDQDPKEITSSVSFAFNQLKVDLEKNIDSSTC